MEIDSAQRGIRSSWDRDGANGENAPPWWDSGPAFTPRCAALDPAAIRNPPNDFKLS